MAEKMSDHQMQDVMLDAMVQTVADENERLWQAMNEFRQRYWSAARSLRAMPQPELACIFEGVVRELDAVIEKYDLTWDSQDINSSIQNDCRCSHSVSDHDSTGVCDLCNCRRYDAYSRER